MTDIRNIVVIAHVDHGKTTLVDALLKQTHTFRDNQEEMQQERIMDSNDLEKERGITITAKNCAIEYNDTKINIIDTPGHADFSGEVERTLGMAEGAVLIVDAQEGPMPQTRFVLRKALEMGLKPIVVINKIDKQFARVSYVIEKTESLFLELATTEDQLNFPVLYAVGRDGKVFKEIPESIEVDADVTPLLDTVVEEVPAPTIDTESNFKMLVSSFEHDTHLGRIAIGKIKTGVLKKSDKVIIVQEPKKVYTIEKLFVSQGLEKVEVESASSGDIVAFSGVPEIKIGQTISVQGETESLPNIAIGEPTIHITIGPNTSPFSGREGEFTTGRQIEERILKELEKNLSLKAKKRGDGKYEVSGRGELHLSVFLENLRREGYEVEVEKPEVVIKEVDGVKVEPFEELDIIVPEEYSGVVNQELGRRYAEVVHIEPINDTEVEFVYNIPTRALLGLRSILVEATKGTVILNSQVIDYKPVGKPIPKMRSGVIISSESGDAVAYGLNAAQGRGTLFIGPATKVYEGMIVGKNAKDDDIAVNVCKGKKLTNMRSKGSDGIIQLAPPTELTLEKCLDFLESDELLEITPDNLRLRKKYLTEIERRRHNRKN